MNRRGRSIALHAALIAGGLVTLFPLLWMLSASFMSNGESTTFPPHLVPHPRPHWRLPLGKGWRRRCLRHTERWSRADLRRANR